jgi:hypothetical protein
VVTDAAYFDKKLYLVGYTKKTEVFLDIFTEAEPGSFSKKSETLLSWKFLSIGQIEGIAVDETGIYISGKNSNLHWEARNLPYILSPKINSRLILS